MNDLRALFHAVELYASEHDGLLPPISPARGNLMIDPVGFYPEYLTNSCWVQCEYSPARQRRGSDGDDDLGMAAFNDDSFCYLPWEIRNEEEGLAFIEAYKKLDLAKRGEDLVVEIDGETRVLPRVRLSAVVIGGGWDTDAADIPFVVEWPDHAHIDGTVCFTNGSIGRMDIGDGFPMTEAFLTGLREIASMDKPVPVWKVW